MLLDTMFELPDMDDVEKVVVSKATVDDGKQPVFVHSDKKKKKSKAKDDEDKAEAEAG